MAFQFPQLIHPRKESKARQRRHLSMEEGSLFVLFCLHPIRSTELGGFRLRSWSLWKALKGASAWFHGIWTCSAKVLEY
jgi:hypothetical protein